EEIGYVAGRLELLTSILTAPGFTDEVIHIYKATGMTAGRQQLDRDEVLEVLEISLEEAIKMIKAGTIRDAKTIVGLELVGGGKGAEHLRSHPLLAEGSLSQLASPKGDYLPFLSFSSFFFSSPKVS